MYYFCSYSSRLVEFTCKSIFAGAKYDGRKFRIFYFEKKITNFLLRKENNEFSVFKKKFQLSRQKFAILSSPEKISKFLREKDGIFNEKSSHFLILRKKLKLSTSRKEINPKKNPEKHEFW